MIDETLVKRILEINKEGRNRENFEKIIGPLRFLKEYCTIRVNLGRQLGHTTNFIQVLRENLTVYVFYKEDFAEECRIKFKLEKRAVFTKRNYLKKFLDLFGPGFDMDYILIDLGFLWSSKDEDKLYGFLASKEIYPTIVFIG